MRSDDVRHHLRFDVARLRSAALRVQAVDDQLRGLRRRLEARAGVLRDEADGESAYHDAPEPGPVDPTPLRNAQAQATAELARRAALREVLRHSSAFSLVAAMAVSRWVQAIVSSAAGGASLERQISSAKGHIDAGRLAHRMLVTLRRGRGLRSGCGQLVCAVVVAELTPPELSEFLAEEIEEGLGRALTARGVRSHADALAAASAALRQGAKLLEGMAERAEPAALDLVTRADAVEGEVERRLATAELGGHGPAGPSGHDGEA